MNNIRLNLVATDWSRKQLNLIDFVLLGMFPAALLSGLATKLAAPRPHLDEIGSLDFPKITTIVRNYHSPKP